MKQMKWKILKMKQYQGKLVYFTSALKSLGQIIETVKTGIFTLI